MIDITRYNDVTTITATSGATVTSPRVAYGQFTGGAVIVANTNSCTAINWHGADTDQSLPRQIYNATGNAVTSALTVGVLPFPAEAYSLPFVTPVVVGASTCQMTVVRKS